MTTNPFGTTPPTIPTIANMGNAALIDDPEYPPIPTQQPTADQLNLHDICSAGAVLMIPFLRVRVTWDGVSAYSLHSFQTLHPAMSAGDIGITKTALGKVSITVTPGKLPASTVIPLAWAFETGAHANGKPDPNGAKVELTIPDGSYNDATFECEIWGHS